MAKIAILGFGTVGSGVYEVLCRNAAGVSRRAGEPVEVKYILDPKDFSAHPAANLFIKNFDTILEDHQRSSRDRKPPGVRAAVYSTVSMRPVSFTSPLSRSRLVTLSCAPASCSKPRAVSMAELSALH